MYIPDWGVSWSIETTQGVPVSVGGVHESLSRKEYPSGTLFTSSEVSVDFRFVFYTPVSDHPIQREVRK